MGGGEDGESVVDGGGGGDGECVEVGGVVGLVRTVGIVRMVRMVGIVGMVGMVRMCMVNLPTCLLSPFRSLEISLTLSGQPPVSSKVEQIYSCKPEDIEDNKCCV